MPVWRVNNAEQFDHSERLGGLEVFSRLSWMSSIKRPNEQPWHHDLPMSRCHEMA